MARGVRFMGLNHRVAMKRPRNAAWRTRRAMENFLDRNVSSLKNFQFTVHWYSNTREKLNARAKYARQLRRRKGIATSSCCA